MPDHYRRLFDHNRAWAAERTAEDAAYFTRLAAGQSPDFLFIGCADSRVSAQEITGTHLGEMFVHRNIANLVLHSDMNVMSVLQYAVEVLEVDHVIVCGHHGCGGVYAAVDGLSHGLIDNWLRHITDVAHVHRAELDRLEPAARHRRLVELNVIEQVRRVRATSVAQAAIARRGLRVHGWVYAMDTGLLHELDVGSDTGEDELFRYVNL